ncbi:ankyrin repeat domain-containing protein [Leptospira alexanderi]|uniref:ankyrin repeat domain-containing protein n=1 Tax=Leptospira alexanderi TaxID=100053 RepID=UPI000990B8A0|nr:ankyrin repeat domain-containing protein [Leptospira alexanderi]
MSFFSSLLYEKIPKSKPIFLFLIFLILSSSEVFGKSISKADRKILSAAISGNLRLAQKALKQGASVHARDPRQYFLGETPLHKVVFNNDVSFVRFLLSQGADPNLSDDRGETPLITAVYGLSLESVSVLLDAKADPYIETKSGISPAVLAADLCSLPVLKLLKNAGVDFNRLTKKGFLPIYTAVGRCNRKLIQFLVESGSTIESPTTSGVTPLMNAIRYKNLDAIHFLFERNVSAAPVDKYGRDALYYLLGFQQELGAITSDAVSRHLTSKEIKTITIYLIQQGTPLDREYKDGRTALFLLLSDYDDDHNFSEFFFQYCKTNQIDLNRPNRFGLTPFQYYELQKFIKQEDWNQIDRFLLNLNDKNPSAAFHAIFLINYGNDNNTTIRTILKSFLSQPKLPELEWLELPLWRMVFVSERDPKLMKLLTNRFPEPPASYSDWEAFDRSKEVIPKNPKELKLWTRSLQKEKKIELFGSSLRTSQNGINSALNKCRSDLLKKLFSQTSLWQLTGPEGFSKHFYNILCEDEKEEEEKLYQSLHSIGANPGRNDWIRLSPLCAEIPTEEKSKDPKIRERSLRKISILLKLGASPNCYVDWGADTTTGLDAAKKYGLKHLEELLLSFGAEDQRKLPLQKAIVAKDKNEIQKLLNQGAVIDVEELKLAKGDSKILSYLLEEYNSLRKSPLLREIKIQKYLGKPVKVIYDLSFLQILLKKGFSLKVRSLDEDHIVKASATDGYTYRTSCAVAKVMDSDSKNLTSLLRFQNFSDYSCRGFTWFFFEEKMREKTKNLKLDSVFPEFQEESYLYKSE